MAPLLPYPTRPFPPGPFAGTAPHPDLSGMPPKRRASDRTWVRVIGWMACFALAASLTYTFVRALREGPGGVDPVFFGLQAAASTLFLVYSIRLRNRVFIVANAVAVANAAGTLLVRLLHG